MTPITRISLQQWANACLLLTFVATSVVRGGAAQLNILLITADDLGYEAVNYLGGEVPDVTPNLDSLASESMNLTLGYNNVAICAPSRSVIATGRYGHNSGLFGFNKLTRDIPTTFGTFQKAGYLTGVLGKVSHSTPDTKFQWDFAHDYGELGSGRSPTLYHDFSAEFFERCEQENKPFYFMVNSHDPHRPFNDPARPMRNAEEPSRLFSPGEIAVPPFLPDLPEVRTELAHYYNSVRRFDDTVGKVLEALDSSGLAERTLVVLISDNGSAFPFAKANVYLASNRTPLLVRWPGVTKPGSVDKVHFVSEVDFFPTFLEACGLPPIRELNGRSLVSLLKGEQQPGREFVFTQIDYTIGGPAKPMRSVQNADHAYIFNAWSDGQFNYRNNNEGETFKAMQAAGANDPSIRARVEMFRHRVPREFYDLQQDPGCTNNLISSAEHQQLIETFETRLRQWMLDTKDHCLASFDARNIPAQLAAAVRQYPKLEGRGNRDKKANDESAAKRKARRLKQQERK
jgi:N-sulfoglucosamine sulfohydrolase